VRNPPPAARCVDAKPRLSETAGFVDPISRDR